ncbi:MAG TPA: diphthamide synthesis protein [Candidatus Nanoarchaeia archaeon]|nr:diphthamide synthesis protein [Candidatus Nanoarchaeia archaeon]
MEFDFSLVNKSVRKGDRVLIQLPAGLRDKTIDISRVVLSLGATPIIWAGSCYGACDLPDFKCDVLLHFGHSEMPISRA